MNLRKPGASTRSPFGFPIVPAEDGSIAVLGEPVRSEVPEPVPADFVAVRRLLRRNLALMRASGRWQPGRPDPEVFVPGDAPMIQALAVTSIYHRNQAVIESIATGSIGVPTVWLEEAVLRRWVHDARRLLEAVPFFMPAPMAVSVMESTPPDGELFDQLRLPFPAVAVTFSAELQFDHADLLSGAIVELDDVEAIPFVDGIPTILDNVVSKGGGWCGVVFFAGEEGIGLRDEVLWIVSTDPPESQPLDRDRIMLWGRPSAASLAPAVRNLAAAVAWGSWVPPRIDLELPDFDNKEFKSFTNKGRFRRMEPHGGAVGVHVLDVGKMSKPSDSGDAGSDKREIAAHLRRGHWKRVRCGPMDDWHYEARWIAPVVVNPTSGVLGRVQVYRLPRPPEDIVPKESADVQ